jgi:NAD(P)-dependent dehydrogenase (short-subunit alcohol dehydrogenase family)
MQCLEMTPGKTKIGQLDTKVGIMTGAPSGMGAATARALAREAPN